MDTLPYKLLVIDTENSSVLLTDGDKGEILSEWPFPKGYTPLDIQLNADRTIAYIPASSKNGRGLLFSLLLADGQLVSLPLDLPPIERFAAGPQLGQAVLATPEGELFSLDISSRSLFFFGRSGLPSACVGLAADREAIYTVWQHEGNGILAVFSVDGQLRDERFLSGLPTGLSQSDHYVFIPFTAAQSGDEGVMQWKKSELADGPPARITLHHCPDEAAFRIYPCYVAVTPDETIAYVVQEDSASISLINVQTASVCGYIPVGRSLSCMALLPDSQFAIAGSYMFADLTLIDLVNRRLLSLTDSERELFGQVAVIP